jgi:hypothetical protein
MTDRHNLLELFMKLTWTNWMPFFASLTCGSMAFASIETIEIAWDQTAALGATDCCSHGSLGSFDGTFTTTKNCQSYAGSCITSRRWAFWTFDLSQLPENATIMSASFKGLTEYNDMGGNATIKLKALTNPLSTQVAMSIINTPDWQSQQYVSGGSFSIPLSASAITTARLQGKIGLYEYISNSGGVDIYNFGSQPARLSLVVDIPSVWGACCTTYGSCVYVPQYNCENAGFAFLGEDIDCTPSICNECPGDFDSNGIVDVNDLLLMISVYGTSDTDHDLDGDGIVGINDLLLFLDAYGECS